MSLCRLGGAQALVPALWVRPNKQLSQQGKQGNQQQKPRYIYPAGGRCPLHDTGLNILKPGYLQAVSMKTDTDFTGKPGIRALSGGHCQVQVVIHTTGFRYKIIGWAVIAGIINDQGVVFMVGYHYPVRAAAIMYPVSPYSAVGIFYGYRGDFRDYGIGGSVLCWFQLVLHSGCSIRNSVTLTS